MDKKRTTLVIGKFPTHSQENDGMMIRVKEIDSLLGGHTNVKYLDIRLNLRPPITRIINNREIFSLSIITGYRKIFKLLNESSIIYCHSILNFTKITPYIFFTNCNIFIDLHGAVPEETKQNGRKIQSLLLELIEKLAVRRSKLIICVTKSMEKHIREKHTIKKDKFLLLPIFNKSFLEESDIEASRKHLERDILVIYAGGSQVWQNIDMMKEAADKNTSVKYEIYLSKKHTEQDKRWPEGVLVSSLSRSELAIRYRKAHLGFLLRDDTIVNRVALPTKLNEYIENGILPILLENCIGDMQNYGYNYIKYQDFIENNLPPPTERMRMATENYSKYIKQLSDASNGRERLIQELLAGVR